MRGIPPILIQFGGLCVAAGLIVGFGAGWYFAFPLVGRVAMMCAGMCPVSGPDTVVENTIDPLLQILDKDPGMEAPAVLAKFFPKSYAGFDAVEGDRPVLVRPAGATAAIIRSGSCVLLYDSATRLSLNKVLYRTDMGWGGGYMESKGLTRVTARDCRARILPQHLP